MRNHIQRFAVAATFVLSLLTTSLPMAACEFAFSYDHVEASLGTLGEIGVRVTKEHADCTLPSMDDYQFAWAGIQVLGETPWEEIDTNVYEKWFQVSLSAIGDGFLRISKDCSKEGYQEAVLPIAVLAPSDDGTWAQAYNGIYPFADPQIGSIESTSGDGRFQDEALVLGDLLFHLPGVSVQEGDLGAVRVYYVMDSSGDPVPLLAVSEQLFLRLDHLVADAS